MLKLANNGFLLFTMFAVDLIAGTLLFAHIEHHSVLRSLYWAVVTGITVGYGDISPETDLGMIITICFILTSWLLAVLVAAYIVIKSFIDHDKFTHEEQERFKGQIEELLVKVEMLLSNLLSESEQREIKESLQRIETTLRTDT